MHISRNGNANRFSTTLSGSEHYIIYCMALSSNEMYNKTCKTKNSYNHDVPTYEPLNMGGRGEILFNTLTMGPLTLANISGLSEGWRVYAWPSLDRCELSLAELSSHSILLHLLFRTKNCNLTVLQTENEFEVIITSDF